MSIPKDYIAPEDRTPELNQNLSFCEAWRLVMFGRRVKLPEWTERQWYTKSMINKVGSMPIEWILRDDWQEVVK